MPDGEASLAPPLANDLGTEKQNAERDGCVEGQHGSTYEAQRRDGERDAMSNRKRRDRLYQHPSIGNDQHEAQNKKASFKIGVGKR